MTYGNNVIKVQHIDINIFKKISSLFEKIYNKIIVNILRSCQFNLVVGRVHNDRGMAMPLCCKIIDWKKYL